MTPPVIVRQRKGSTWLILNRPESGNAISVEMRDELFRLLSAARHTDQPLLLFGNGRHFCTGGDLTEFSSDPSGIESLSVRSARHLAAVLLPLRNRLTTIVHGACIGGGVEIAAYSRVLLSTSDAVFRLPELQMGLTTGIGGWTSISARIGRGALLRLLLTGETLSATEAQQLGLVDAIIAPEDMRRWTST